MRYLVEAKTAEAEASHKRLVRLLRYPGGKGRLLVYFKTLLPNSSDIPSRYIEPFVGGGAVFFHMRPSRAILSDINEELILLYQELKRSPKDIWREYSRMPADKEGYYKIRGMRPDALSGPAGAARLLFLSRTCFKGMWRHNKAGDFNVGYGGQERRSVVTEDELNEASKCLKHADIIRGDFEAVIELAEDGDFLFLDPPYRPGMKDPDNRHYSGEKFDFADQLRLADTLRRATTRGARWLMTNSAHPEIRSLYQGYRILPLKASTGQRPGQLICGGHSSEVAITNVD